MQKRGEITGTENKLQKNVTKPKICFIEKMAKPLARLKEKKQFMILGMKEGASLQILQIIKKGLL